MLPVRCVVRRCKVDSWTRALQIPREDMSYSAMRWCRSLLSGDTVRQEGGCKPSRTGTDPVRALSTENPWNLRWCSRSS